MYTISQERKKKRKKTKKNSSKQNKYTVIIRNCLKLRKFNDYLKNETMKEIAQI